MINTMRKDIEKLVSEEYERAIREHGYALSDYEGLALLREEICEAQSEINLVIVWEVALKQSVYRNECHQYSKLVNEIKQKAINGACELIQVAAMCDKFESTHNVREGEKDEKN